MDNRTIVKNTVKGVHNNKYVVELLELTTGGYVIRFGNLNAIKEYSNPIRDFGIASYLFDIKIKNLESH